MKKKKIAFIILSALCLWGMWFVWGRDPYETGPDYREIYRVPSPDSLYDAVYQVEFSGGAVGSVSHLAYIVPRGSKPLGETRFIFGTHFDSVSISWLSDDKIFFTQTGGRVITFENEVCVKNGKDGMIEYKGRVITGNGGEGKKYFEIKFLSD